MSVIRPGIQTLTTKAEFDRVFAERKRFSRDGLAFYYFEQRQGCTRLGIMTPRRFGNAVQRNLFRRRLKEIFRRLPITPPADIVITVYRPYEKLGFDLLQRTIRWGVEKICRYVPTCEGSSFSDPTSASPPLEDR